MKGLQMKRKYGRIAVISLAIILIGIIIFVRQTPGNRLKRLMKQGNELLLEQEYKKAVDKFTKALSIDDKNATAYFARGDAYAGLGETQKARLDYIRAEELNEGMTSAVEQKLAHMNDMDLTKKASVENGAPDDVSTESSGESTDVIKPETEVAAVADAENGAEVIFNQEAIDATAYAGDPETFPSQQEMILTVAGVYNTFQASSEGYREEPRGPMTVYYDKEDGHIACILAPEGTYEDHANAFEHTLNAQYYYRLKDNGSVEPAFIYLYDSAHTEEHMIYLWEGRVIRYVGPVDASDYQQDFTPGLTIREFADRVPQGVFAANACIELSWLSKI